MTVIIGRGGVFGRRRRWPAGGLRRSAAGLLAVALIGVAGCAGPGAGSGGASSGVSTRIFVADNGEVSIPVKPTRIVATGYAVPVLIEAGASLVGISEFKRSLPMMDGPDRATYDRLPKVAGETAASTNYEAIAQAAPDLIIIGVPRPVLSDVAVDRLAKIAPVVAIGPSVPSAWKVFAEQQADAAGALDGFAATKAAYQAKAESLQEKYGSDLADLQWAHVGGYGEVSRGNFQREFADSWGTNIAQDAGVRYYGQVREKTGGSGDVSENRSLEELPESVADADVISYTVQPDGSPGASVRLVLESQLWKRLPQVKTGKVVSFRYTEASTYKAATKTLTALDTELAGLVGSR